MKDRSWVSRPEQVLNAAKMLLYYLGEGPAPAFSAETPRWAIGANHMQMALRLLYVRGKGGKWELSKCWKRRLWEFGLNQDLEIIDHFKFSLAWDMVTERHPERPHYRLHQQEFRERLRLGIAPKNPQAMEIVSPGFKKRKTPEVPHSKNGRLKQQIEPRRIAARVFNQRVRSYLSELQDED